MPYQLHVMGLKSLRDDLSAIDADLPRELRKVNSDAAKKAQDASQTAASGLGSVQAKAVDAIKASATQTASALVIDANKVPYALGAFMGAKRFPQFPAWVGNTWEPGGPGGPYAVGEALRTVADEIETDYGHAIDRLLHTDSTVFGAGIQGDVTTF